MYLLVLGDIFCCGRDGSMNTRSCRLATLVSLHMWLCGPGAWNLASTSAHAALARLQGEAHMLATRPEMMSRRGGLQESAYDAMQGIEIAYNLELVFAVQEGNAWPDVLVVITDEHNNKVIDMVLAGPLLYIKLPPGRYTVTAQINGHTQHRTVQVRQRQPPVSLHW